MLIRADDRLEEFAANILRIMKSNVTPKGLKKIAFITFVGIIVVAVFKQFVPYTVDKRQLANLAAAEQHTPILRAVLQRDLRFTNVTVYVFTGAGGSLQLHGELLSARDLADLKELVQKTKPPVEVLYDVFVIPPE
jgi:hypothetical protein